MSDKPFTPRPPRAGVLDALTNQQKALAAIIFFLTIGAGVAGFGFRVTAIETVQAQQGDAMKKLDAEAELLFEAKVETSSKLQSMQKQLDTAERRDEWTNAVLFKMAQDAGVRVTPPPSPVPRPTP